MRVTAIAVLFFAPTAFAADIKGLTLDGDKFAFDDGKLKFKGVYVKPAGKGPFPAILVSHGRGGNGEQFGRQKAREFTKWGFAIIAPDYTHGEPKGDQKTFGASEENIKRAKKCLDILQSQPEIDGRKLFAYGNSMGAFLTIGLAAEEDRLMACAITAGGINEKDGFAAPSRATAAKIKTPFLILHGLKDTTVPPERSKLLESVLNENKVNWERHTYEGIAHDLHQSQAKDVNDRIETWFRKYSKEKAK